MSEARIHLSDVHVDGVNTHLRAQHIKQFLVGGKKLGQNVRIPILRGVSLEVKPGERLGIVGRNGSGKSSLLKVIAGIYPPASGTVQVSGSVAPLIEMSVGFNPELTGRENIKIGLIYTGRMQHYSEALEQNIIAFTGLGEHIDRPLKGYSSGMQARLSFAVSFFQDPDILLLDEAFAPGDADFITRAAAAMREKFSQVPIAVLVSHSNELIASLCTRCVWMERGEIVADGPPADVLGAYMKGAA
jgi:ABC-type polysaccharide/polyol phosphate transport system ATPase subunit